jgi:hypothetical protein
MIYFSELKLTIAGRAAVGVASTGCLFTTGLFVFGLTNIGAFLLATVPSGIFIKELQPVNNKDNKSIFSSF